MLIPVASNTTPSTNPITKPRAKIKLAAIHSNNQIYFLIVIMKDIKTALKSEELKIYLLMYIFAVVFILINTMNSFVNISEALISSFFHVSSVMTSTGYSIGDINIMPTSCRIIVLFLMLVSACAGSTCGGFKISRLLGCAGYMRVCSFLFRADADSQASGMPSRKLAFCAFRRIPSSTLSGEPVLLARWHHAPFLCCRACQSGTRPFSSRI